MPTVKILLVDDIAQNLVALQALLERPGVELLHAGSGPEALEILLAQHVALALLDVQMPGMDGFELAELMRGSPRTRHVPIIFLTAADRNSLRTFRGYEAGAVDFLYKPLDPHILRSKVDIFIRLHRVQRQLTEHNESLQRALHTNEMFVAVLGHDLRNPLSAIMNLGEVIARTGESERIRALGQRVCDSGTRMGRLVNHMFDLASMRAGMLVLTPETADIAQVCENVVRELTIGRAIQPIDIMREGDTTGWWDTDRLAQVFSNLIGNAVQHGIEAPIQVEIEGDQTTVSVRVRNHGSIPEGVAQRLFEPFAREPGTSPSKGLGLGLYIAHELVRLHQGTISATSVEGTIEFTVTLPRQTSSSQAASPSV